MSDICRHDVPLSEHCWDCDADHTKMAVKCERERILAVIQSYIEENYPVFTDGKALHSWNLMIERIREGR